LCPLNLSVRLYVGHTDGINTLFTCLLTEKPFIDSMVTCVIVKVDSYWLIVLTCYSLGLEYGFLLVSRYRILV